MPPIPTAVQSTTARSPTQQPPTPLTALESLQGLTITNAADFISHLKPRTPVQIDLLETYLEDHPNPNFVSCLCLGLREGFRIGYSGPRTPTSYPNLHSAKLHPDILENNLLTEVLNGHTAGPFPSAPFKNFRNSHWALSPKNTLRNGVPSFTCHTPKPPPPASMPTSLLKTIPSSMSL